MLLPANLHNRAYGYLLLQLLLSHPRILNAASTLSQSTAPPTVSYLGTKPPPSSTACGGVGKVEEKDQCRPQAEGEDESAGVPSPSPSLSKVSAQLQAALDECSQKLQVLCSALLDT